MPFKESFFLIDPLDGTKEFVAGRNEFTVNLALVTHGMPLLGIVGAPALGLIWRGIVGRGAERLTLRANAPLAEPIRTRACPPRGEPWTVAVSRSHGDARTEAFIAERPGAVRSELGSAVKFGRVAEGLVDIYPRLSPTCEWDVGGRPCGHHRGRRQDHRFKRRAPAFRRRARGFHHSGVHRLGRSDGGGMTLAERRASLLPPAPLPAPASAPRRL